MTIISDKLMDLGGSKFGKPVSAEHDAKRGGRSVELEQIIKEQKDKITIYQHSKTGVHYIRGLIRQKWIKAGELDGLGYPKTDESDTRDGNGRYNDFQWGSIYFHKGEPEAFILRGTIKKKWFAEEDVTGLGYPITDERRVGKDQKGRYNEFKSANREEIDLRSIYWHPKTDAHVVRGAILDKWRSEGGIGTLGYPVTDELIYSDDKGRISYFQKGVIIHYWEGQLTYVSEEKSKKTRFYFGLSTFARISILVILALTIWIGSLIYAVHTNSLWLLAILLPSGGLIPTLLNPFLQKIADRVVDSLLLNDKVKEE